MKNSIKFEDMKSQWMKDPDFRKAYDDLELEAEIIPPFHLPTSHETPPPRRRSKQQKKKG